MKAANREDLASCFDHTTINGGVIIIPLSSITGSPNPAGAVDAVKDMSSLLAKMNSNPRSNEKTCLLVLAAHDTGGSFHPTHQRGDSSSSTDDGGGGGSKRRESSDVWTTAAANSAARKAAMGDPLNIHFVDGFHASEPLRFNGKVSSVAPVVVVVSATRPSSDRSYAKPSPKAAWCLQQVSSPTFLTIFPCLISPRRQVSREEFPPSFYQMQIESIIAAVHDKCGIGLGGRRNAAQMHEENSDSDAVRERHRREEKRRDSYRVFVAP